MLGPGAIVDPEDLRIPGEQPGTPIIVIDDLGEVPHGFRYRARQGKSLLLLTVIAPEVLMQRELRDLLSHRVVLASEIEHPNLLPTYGCVRLPLPDDEGFDTMFLVRPDPGCPTLRQWLHEVWQAGHALDVLNAVAITVQVCEALAALHERLAHGYVTMDNIYMYPTGGMPQALLGGIGEGALLPYAPGFDAFVRAGHLPMAGRELFEPPHEPRVETDVLGAAALVLEILTGQPLEPGMSLDRFGLPSRVQRVLEVAGRPDPEDRPQDILMFSRRLQAAVGLGDDPAEPSAVLEPIHHGEHSDPHYPAVRARPWRPPPPAPPPWAADVGPSEGSGAWNVGAPTPGSGAWKVGAPTPGSGAWSQPSPPGRPGSGAWRQPQPPGPSSGSGSWSQPGRWSQPQPPGSQSGSGPWSQPQPQGYGQPPSSRPGSGSWSQPEPSYPQPPSSRPGSGEQRQPRVMTMSRPAPSPLGRDFPALTDPSLEPMDEPGTPPSYPTSQPAPPPPVSAPLPPPPSFPSNAHSVSIVMPAPDGSMMAPLSRGPRDYTITRRGKVHGPYSLAQLEKLIPMGKLRSVDTIQIQSSGEKILAVDLPGMRPLFEERAKVEEASVVRPMPTPPPVAAPAPSGGRGMLWLIVALLALGVIGIGTLYLMR